MLDADQQLRQRVLDGSADGLEVLLDALVDRRSRLGVVRDALEPAMHAVCERYRAGTAVLPSVLASAEVMRRALDYLEAGASRGSIVVATLEGDVHHIGKALLVSLLDASGFRVHDLGHRASIKAIVDAAVQTPADAIGLSALLVSTSQQMPACVQELDRRDVHVPVLVGGAAINRAFGRRVGVLPDGRIYEPGVFYCRDVFEGLSILDDLFDPVRRETLIAANRVEVEAERDRPALVSGALAGAPATLEPASVPGPPHWGRRVVRADLHAVWQHLDRNTLFRHHWGGFHAKGTDYERLLTDEFEPLLAELQADAVRDGWLEARIVMGYFRCAAEAEALLIFHPDNPERVVRQLAFPRQAGGERLCLADYFRPLASGARDVIVLQAVSTGARAGEYVDELQRAGAYRRMLFVNGLASATAEALAEYAFQLARHELGLSPGRGVRFSWGYAACPDLMEQEKILTLLGAAAEIGLTLTGSGNLEPEHSTAAMIVHHPAAKYFSV